MVQQPQKIIRVKFEKTGKLQYISHLDLLRTMQTALRRAKVKMIYSEGFNPHMKITFALPLSIGTESVCEYMDIRTQPDVDPKYVMEALGKNLPDGMKIIDAYEASSKLTDIKYAAYTAMLDYGEYYQEVGETEGGKLYHLRGSLMPCGDEGSDAWAIQRGYITITPLIHMSAKMDSLEFFRDKYER